MNDIKKNLLLIESIILDESFKDAMAKFTQDADEKEVQEYIDLYKELSSRKIITGREKDIGYWIKQDWESFRDFVDSKKEMKSNRETTKLQKKDSIIVYNDDTKQVVIPLTKEASIQYGKNTAWCTAYTDAPNQFIKYFYIYNFALFYVLFKDGNKYACAFHPKRPDTIECFDQQDEDIHFDKFEKITGISNKDIRDWYSSNKTKIENSRDLNNSSEEVQLAIVTQDARAIKHINNPSEKVQLAIVNQEARAIRYIVDKGIVPSEKVQLAAVKQNTRAIDYIDNPSEKVQLAAVTQDARAIKHIVNKGIVPSEKVQLAAVNQEARAILYIDNPTEKVQLAAVSQESGVILYIQNPTEQVIALYKKLWR